MLRLFTTTNAMLVAIVTELIVLGIAAMIASDTAMFWQYAARYSARISFVIITGLLLYTAINGFLTINNIESKRRIFGALLYLFCTNHIIHLIYLTANQIVRNNILITPANIPGMIAYGVILVLPLLLHRGLKNKKNQTMLLVSLLLISTFFIKIYISRLFSSSLPPDASAAWVYVLFASVLILLVLANLYRHIMDGRAARISSS